MQATERDNAPERTSQLAGALALEGVRLPMLEPETFTIKLGCEMPGKPTVAGQVAGVQEQRSLAPAIGVVYVGMLT